eukprot:6039965-Amphidinium_carterae.1
MEVASGESMRTKMRRSKWMGETIMKRIKVEKRRDEGEVVRRSLRNRGKEILHLRVILPMMKEAIA